MTSVQSRIAPWNALEVPTRKARLGAIALVLAVGGVGAGFLATELTAAGGAGPDYPAIYMPKVIGLPADVAVAKLTGDTPLPMVFTVLHSVQRKYHGYCRVIAQNPHAGQGAIVRSVAILTVEGCPSNQVVGKLVGKRIDRVLPGLHAAGFTVFESGGGYPGMPHSYDYVVGLQEPPAGTRAAPGSQVWVDVNLPRPK